MKRFINDRLSHLRTDEERNDVVTMLIFLGLKHHSILCPQETALRKSSLKILCEQYMQDSNTTVGAHRKSSPSAVLTQRKHRPDSTAHFPFADEFGTVSDVLHRERERDKPRLLEMGGPARKRLIERVFEEMRCDGRGIRMSDLPEALERVGIEISPRLRRLLEKTRSNVVNGPISFNDEDRRMDIDDEHLNPIMLQYMEKHVPLPLWKAVVKRFLSFMRNGENVQEIEQVFPQFSFSRESEPRKGSRPLQSLTSDEEEDDEEDEDSLDYVDESPPRAMRERNEDEHTERKKSQSPPKRPSSRSHSRSRSRSKQERARDREREKEREREDQQRRMSQQTQQYYRNIERVPSRLREVIQHDRETFKHKDRAIEKSALQTIAHRRAEHFLSSTPPLGFQDKIYRLNEPFSAAAAAAGRAEAARQQKAAKNTMARLAQTESGLAVREIADAFLSSSLGREILSASDRDDDWSMSPSVAMDEVGRKLGLSLPITERERERMRAQQREKEKFVAASMHPASVVVPSMAPSVPPSVTVAPSAVSVSQLDNSQETAQSARRGNSPSSSDRKPPTWTNLGFKTMREKEQEKQADQESKHLYASNWKSSRQGWVADFGPAHTRAFYMGPDVHRDSRSFPRPLSGSAVTLSATERQRMSETALSEKEKERLLRERLARTMDDSESSTSISLAVAGAGAGAMTGFDDDSLSGEQERDDESLSHKFAFTVSLKDIAGK